MKKRHFCGLFLLFKNIAVLALKRLASRNIYIYNIQIAKISETNSTIITKRENTKINSVKSTSHTATQFQISTDFSLFTYVFILPNLKLTASTRICK